VRGAKASWGIGKGLAVGWPTAGLAFLGGVRGTILATGTTPRHKVTSSPPST